MTEVKNINFVKSTFIGSKLANIAFGLSTYEESQYSNNVFFGDVERSTEFERHKKYNKNCLSTDDNKLLHNVFRSDESFFKSAIYLNSKSARTNTTYDYQNITAHKLSPETQLSLVVQTDNIMYALQNASKFGRYDIDCDIYSWISANNGLVIPPDTCISTSIYDLSAIKDALAKNDNVALQKNAVRENLTYVDYNMTYEIPGNFYNDYESGNIGANTYKCKNAFNMMYDMAHDNMYAVKNARQYNKVGNCNKQVFLTYTDNTYYSKKGQKTIGKQTYGLKCEQVEVLGSMNRYANLNGHKTNLYGIATYTNMFNCIKNTPEGNALKNTLKLEIQHAVNDIVKQLAPTNTQLLSSYVNDIN